MHRSYLSYSIGNQAVEYILTTLAVALVGVLLFFASNFNPPHYSA